jgi:DNA (cytosine-5)-methyltransferase 3A
MKVLSLFDGISCCRVALGNAPGIEYLASEIDKNAIKIAKKNYPNTVHLGDVKDISGAKLPSDIDLLIGGSPCTDLSIAMKGRTGLEGNRSKLFYEYLRILQQTKPKWFILENVASMPDKDKDIITEALGVQPVMLNAALVSAQNRRRYFWTNIPIKGLPADRGFKISDVLESEVDEKYIVKSKFTEKKVANRNDVKQVGHVSNGNGQANRVYDPEGKSAPLMSSCGGLFKIGRDVGRRLTKDGVRCDDDKTVKITRRIETREDGKCGTLTSVLKDNLVVGDVIRKLTPVECERLMGLPDNYTEGISMTARYKAIGNAFHVEIIKWILSHIPQ